MALMCTRIKATEECISQEEKQWMTIFPREVVQSYAGSVKYMKQLTIVAVSTITYQKNIFPEESYKSECLGDVELKILKTKCEDELSQIASNALMSSFNALEKKYLQKLVLYLYVDSYHPDNLAEAYTFEYSYSRREPGHTLDSVRTRTLGLLEECAGMASAAANHSGTTYDLVLRLYYNDSAPEDYQAAGFSRAESAEDMLSQLVLVGRALPLRTPYHGLALLAHRRDPPSSHEVNISDRSEGPNVPTFSENEMDEMLDGLPPRVICSCEQTDSYGQMLSCIWCGTLQHGVCYGLRAAGPARHCCVSCWDQKPEEPRTCTKLAKLSHKRRQQLAIFRRALWRCRGERYVRADSLPTNSLKNHLISRHIIVPKQGDMFEVQQDTLLKDLNQFFEPEGDCVVDKLLEESLSQNSDSEPVVKVAVVSQEPTQGTLDPTLKQYREAVLSAAAPLRKPAVPSTDNSEEEHRLRKRTATDKTSRVTTKKMKLSLNKKRQG